jgi:hypothetical protein
MDLEAIKTIVNGWHYIRLGLGCGLRFGNYYAYDIDIDSTRTRLKISFQGEQRASKRENQ